VMSGVDFNLRIPANAVQFTAIAAITCAAVFTHHREDRLRRLDVRSDGPKSFEEVTEAHREKACQPRRRRMLLATLAAALLLPLLYGVGTALPVVGFAVLIALGTNRLAVALNRLQTFELIARRLTAAVFIVVGVYETLSATLYLI